MKKRTFLISVLLLLFCLGGCEKSAENRAGIPSQKPETAEASDQIRTEEEYTVSQTESEDSESGNSSIMGAEPDYPDYADSCQGYISSDSQLTLLAQSRDVWAVPIEYADERYCFTVTDLDYDGHLEVIVANQGGTGHYTYSRFYEMDADGSLKELETSFMEGDSQPDIIEEQMTVYSSFSPTGIRDYYIMHDEIKTAPDCYVYRLTSLCMMGDYIAEIPLASQTVTYEGDDHTAHAFSEDYNGNPLTEEEFWDFPETYYSDLGLSRKTASLHWTDVKELVGKNDDEAAELLRQTYQGFHRQ